MRNRRSRIDLVGDILIKAHGGATMTRLMYDCGLSYKRTKEFVSLLFERGLLKYEPMNANYRPSPEGFRYLEVYDEVNTMTNLINAMKSNLQ